MAGKAPHTKPALRGTDSQVEHNGRVTATETREHKVMRLKSECYDLIAAIEGTKNEAENRIRSMQMQLQTRNEAIAELQQGAPVMPGLEAALADPNLIESIAAKDGEGE